MDVARRMGVADGTLGRIKYGTANPTVDVVDRIARYFRVEPWELLRPVDYRAVTDEGGKYATRVPGLAQAVDALSTSQQAALLRMIESFRSGGQEGET